MNPTSTARYFEQPTTGVAHEGHRSADRLSTISSFGRQSADNRSMKISSADNRPSSNGIFYKMPVNSRPMLGKCQTGYTRFFLKVSKEKCRK